MFWAFPFFCICEKMCFWGVLGRFSMNELGSKETVVIRVISKNELTDLIDDTEVYLKGIKAGYYYEGIIWLKSYTIICKFYWILELNSYT